MKKKFSTLLVLKYFMSHLGKEKVLSISTILGICFVTVIGLLVPIYFKEIIDIISNVGDNKFEALMQIKSILLYYAVTLGFIFISWRTLDYIIPYCYEKLDYNISLSVFEYLHKHSYNFFINNFAGAINKKVGRLVASMQGLYDILIWDFIRFIITLIFVIFVLGTQNIYLGILFFCWIIIFMGISLFLNKFKLPYIEKAANENSKVGGMYADTIVNNYNISIFGTIKREYEYMKNALDKWFFLEKKLIVADLLMFLVLSIISIVGELGLLYFSVNLWYSGAISVGTFVLILTYQINISSQIFSLSNMFGKFGTHIGNSLEMLEILNTPHEIKDAENAKDLEIISGNIEFKDVNFNYNKDVKVFENFNLSIKPGERVGIVGASGSGKSSLVKLLFRFYDLDSGSILINGQDISLVTQDSLRSQISFVPQDTILFHRSLRENIGYSKENVTDEEIIEASKKANCYDFISKLKDGYGTLVGERGIKLSGGERQRVSIARAMLQNNKILVLDEATSALDSQSEKLIQDALENLMEHKTMIVIAHRLSTIMKMDRIVVMENGKIIESGSHKELLAKSGTYKKLWDIQSGGFIGE